jgi:hypothetical protein
LVLNNQFLAEIISYLRSARKSAGMEKRRTARMEIQHKVHVTPLNPAGGLGESFSVITRDISLEGIGLFTARPLRGGQQFIVRLPRSEKETAFILCTSMFCGVLADGLFTIGAKFSRVMDPEEADQLQYASSSEQQRIAQSVVS